MVTRICASLCASDRGEWWIYYLHCASEAQNDCSPAQLRFANSPAQTHNDRSDHCLCCLRLTMRRATFAEL